MNIISNLDLDHIFDIGCQETDRAQSKSKEVDAKEQSANEALRKEKEALMAQLGKIKDALKCIKCSAFDRPVVVLGKCGHNICDPCLKNINQAFDEAVNQRVSTPEAFKVRVCPFLGCNQPIIGVGLPNRASEAFFPDAHSLRNPISYDEALQIEFVASNCLAISAVESLLKELTPVDIDNGIRIYFEPDVSNCFFDQVCYTLAEKLGKDSKVSKDFTVLDEFSKCFCLGGMSYVENIYIYISKETSCVYIVRGSSISNCLITRKTVTFKVSEK